MATRTRAEASPENPSSGLFVRALVIILAIQVVNVGVVLLVILRGGSTDPTSGEDPAIAAEPTYVGGASCFECHEDETKAWRGSHHDLAMQEVSEETVLGDFDEATFTHAGITSTFFRRDGRFMVRTDGPDGSLTEYAIAYVFGVTPLQQYLIAFPGGRYQMLTIFWDSRPREEGGQRWAHLYPGESVRHGDRLHWTGPDQTWNYMCAECHSTNLRKGYTAARDAYETTWSEIDVSCEACHGPGSRHVAYAKEAEEGRRPRDEAWKGLVVRLRDADEGHWIIDEKTGNAKRSAPLTSRAAANTCARCHSRREALTDEVTPGMPLLDTHRPALLDPVLYHADGQILDEVYVHGSFLQSKMYRDGVRCADCHDPHSARVLDDTDKLCATCHLASKYENEAHHGHEPGTRGAACVDCHAPERTYMVVDPRRDHSFRIPRPDLTEDVGAPDVCSRCHEDRPIAWSIEAIDGWTGGTAWREKGHFGEALIAGRENRPGAGRALARLATNLEQPGIARATALAMLRGSAEPEARGALAKGLADGDALVRLGALRAARALPDADRVSLATPLLSDAIRGVRAEAARALTGIPAADLPAGASEARDAALAEYVAGRLFNAERPGSSLDLGILRLDQGDDAGAEAAYRAALRLDPGSAAARVNLADLMRATGRDEEGGRILDEGLEISPDPAPLHHARGLWLVRRKRMPEALRSLARAAELAPDSARFVSVHAIALQSVGRVREAIEVLERALGQHGRNRDVLVALATWNQQVGALDEAVRHARRLVELDPQDPGAKRFLRKLESSRSR